MRPGNDERIKCLVRKCFKSHGEAWASPLLPRGWFIAVNPLRSVSVVSVGTVVSVSVWRLTGFRRNTSYDFPPGADIKVSPDGQRAKPISCLSGVTWVYCSKLCEFSESANRSLPEYIAVQPVAVCHSRTRHVRKCDGVVCHDSLVMMLVLVSFPLLQ